MPMPEVRAACLAAAFGLALLAGPARAVESAPPPPKPPAAANAASAVPDLLASLPDSDKIDYA